MQVFDAQLPDIVKRLSLNFQDMSALSLLERSATRLCGL